MSDIKPGEYLPLEYRHQIQELDQKLHDDNIVALEEALSKREDEMRALARPPYLRVSLFAPTHDAVFDSRLSGTTVKAASYDEPNLSLEYRLSQIDLHRHYEVGALYKLKQRLSLIECVPVELPLHSPNDTDDLEQQRATMMHNPQLMALLADLNAPRSGAEAEFGVDMQRIHNSFAIDDPDPQLCVHLTLLLGPVEYALRAIPLSGYDGSLDDDPEIGFAHLEVLLDRAIGHVGQAFAAAAALRADAVGAAGGGLLAWVVAAGSAQANCSTVCSVSGHCFADVPGGVDAVSASTALAGTPRTLLRHEAAIVMASTVVFDEMSHCLQTPSASVHY